MILAVLLLCVVAAAAIAALCWLSFTRGYNLGWKERHEQMIVSRHSIDRLLDDERQRA